MDAMSTVVQRAAIAVVTLALAGAVLAGCGSPPEPAPPTQEQIDAVRASEAQTWWNSMFTDRPMPEVAVIEELPLEDALARQTQCLEEANIPGVTVNGRGEWSYDGELGDDPMGSAAQEQWWICAQQYPAHSDDGWILSPSQLEWLHGYYTERYIPCLRTVGLEPTGFPSRADFLSNGSYPAWVPHDATVTPIPTPGEWERVADRCPLPEMLQHYGLPGYTDEP